jgi:hypothetical protein
MKPYQMAALRCLASYGLIDSDLLAKKIISKTDKEIPSELLNKINDLSVEKSNIIKLIIGFHELPLYGKAGLKERTGLIEFKYDPR